MKEPEAEEVYQSEELECSAKPTHNGTFSFLTNLIPKSFLSKGTLNSIKDSFTKIGTEELLILALAAFLFFSKDGDRECALMLLALLFVGK